MHIYIKLVYTSLIEDIKPTHIGIYLSSTIGRISIKVIAMDMHIYIKLLYKSLIEDIKQTHIGIYFCRDVC